MSSSSINARCSTSAAFGPRCIRHGRQGKGNRTELNNWHNKQMLGVQAHTHTHIFYNILYTQIQEWYHTRKYYNIIHGPTAYQMEQANPISHFLYWPWFWNVCFCPDLWCHDAWEAATICPIVSTSFARGAPWSSNAVNLWATSNTYGGWMANHYNDTSRGTL